MKRSPLYISLSILMFGLMLAFSEPEKSEFRAALVERWQVISISDSFAGRRDMTLRNEVGQRIVCAHRLNLIVGDFVRIKPTGRGWFRPENEFERLLITGDGLTTGWTGTIWKPRFIREPLTLPR